jgi:hypothetical protein
MSVWKDVSRDFVPGKYRKEYIYWEKGHPVQKFKAVSFVSFVKRFSAFEKRIMRNVDFETDNFLRIKIMFKKPLEVSHKIINQKDQQLQ